MNWRWKKKKFRKIVIDGENWAWAFHAKGDYYEHQSIKIWKDKKIVFEKTYNDKSGKRITPGLIARFIKIYLK